MEDFKIFYSTDYRQNEIKNISFEVRMIPPSNPVKGQFYYSENPTDLGLMVYTGTIWVNVFNSYVHYLRTNGSFSELDTFVNVSVNNSVKIIKKITITDEGHIDDIEFHDLTLDDLGGVTEHTHNTSEIEFNNSNVLLGSNPSGDTIELTPNDVLIFLSIAHGDLSLLQSDSSTQQRTWTALDLRTFIQEYLTSAFSLSVQHNPTNVEVEYTNGNNTDTIVIDLADSTNAGAYPPEHFVKMGTLEPHPLYNTIEELETNPGLNVITDADYTNGHITKLKSKDITQDVRDAVINDSATTLEQTWSSQKITDYVIQRIGDDLVGALIYQAIPYAGQQTQTFLAPIPETNTTINKAMVWVVSSGGYFGSQQVSPGDMIISLHDNASTEAMFQVINKNIDDIVDASEADKGIISIITNAEIDSNSNDDTKALTLRKLKYYLQSTTITNGHSVVIGNGVDTEFIISHGLDSLNIISEIYELVSGVNPDFRVRAGYGVIDEDTARVKFNSPPPPMGIRVVSIRY